METALLIIQVCGSLLSFTLVIWLSRIIGTLKGGIESQKSIIESFKEQTTYVSTLQSTLSKLYDPTEIENIVRIKTQAAIEHEEAQMVRNLEGVTDNLRALYSYIARSAVYLDESAIREILKKQGNAKSDQEVEEFVWEVRREIVGIRRNALSESPSKPRTTEQRS